MSAQREDRAESIAGIFVLCIMSFGFVCFGFMGLYGISKGITAEDTEWTALIGGLLVTLLFGGVGTAIGYLAWLLISDEIALSNARKRNPQKNWLTRTTWESNKQTHSHWPTAIIWIVVAAIANTLVWGIVSLLWLENEFQESSFLVLVMPIFGFAGAWLAKIAIRNTRTAMRYGTTSLELHRMPIQIGEKLVARATVQRPRETARQEYMVSLRCVSPCHYDSNKGSLLRNANDDEIDHRCELTLFEQCKIITAKNDRQTHALDFEFAIPDNSLPSNQSNDVHYIEDLSTPFEQSFNRRTVEWHLAVRDADWCQHPSSVPYRYVQNGLNAEFEIPIVSHTKGLPQQTLSDFRKSLSGSRSLLLADSIALGRGRIVNDSPHEFRATFKNLLQEGWSVEGYLLLGLWFLMALGILFADAIFGVIFLALGILALWTKARESETVEIRATTEHIEVENVAFTKGSQLWRLEQIRNIQAELTFSSQFGVTESVVLYSDDSQTTRLLVNLPSRFVSNSIAQRLANHVKENTQL